MPHYFRIKKQWFTSYCYPGKLQDLSYVKQLVFMLWQNTWEQWLQVEGFVWETPSWKGKCGGKSLWDLSQCINWQQAERGPWVSLLSSFSSFYDLSPWDAAAHIQSGPLFSGKLYWNTVLVTCRFAAEMTLKPFKLTMKINYDDVTLCQLDTQTHRSKS